MGAFERQSGMALVTGLIFMVVLTLLATVSMRNTVMEERMAGNTRDIDLAFQAAEAALRAGEQVVNGATLPNFGTSGPYLSVGVRDDNYWLLTHNWANNSIALATAPAGVAAAPSFVVEALPAVTGGSAGGTSLKFGALVDSGYYRVTARGVGGAANTLVFLQTTYRR